MRSRITRLDPDTLVARMTDSGIAEIGPGDELEWREPRATNPAPAAVDAVGSEDGEARSRGTSGDGSALARGDTVRPEADARDATNSRVATD